MISKWQHKRYFRVRLEDSSVYTFTSTADANTKIGFKACYSTSTPTKTEELADSGQTFVVKYKFNSEPEQIAFKAAIDAEWQDSGKPFTGAGVEHFKTEWLDEWDQVSGTSTFPRIN